MILDCFSGSLHGTNKCSKVDNAEGYRRDREGDLKMGTYTFLSFVAMFRGRDKGHCRRKRRVFKLSIIVIERLVISRWWGVGLGGQ